MHFFAVKPADRILVAKEFTNKVDELSKKWLGQEDGAGDDCLDMICYYPSIILTIVRYLPYILYT